MSYITQDLAKADCTLAAGVFTVTLPSVCKVVLPSTTAGANVSIDLGGKSYTIQDDSHASSHLGALGFGITETADWANDMPFFIYLVNEDNTAANVGLFVTRSPCMAVTPAATYIHDKTAAAANDTQASILGAWADDAGKAAKPCILIGAIRMRWSTTTDDWTIQVLGNTDGIGQDRIDKTLSTTWTFPVGQNGAAASGHGISNGGTVPAVTTDTITFTLASNGICNINVDWHGDTVSEGAGSVRAKWALPYRNIATETYNTHGIGYIVFGGTTLNNAIIMVDKAVSHFFSYSSATAAALQWRTYSTGFKQMWTSFFYKAY